MNSTEFVCLRMISKMHVSTKEAILQLWRLIQAAGTSPGEILVRNGQASARVSCCSSPAVEAE
jgi:hypothetical protein